MYAVQLTALQIYKKSIFPQRAAQNKHTFPPPNRKNPGRCVSSRRRQPMIMNTLWIVLPALTLLMFHLGLGLTLKDFGKVLRHPGPVERGAVKSVSLDCKGAANLATHLPTTGGIL